MPRGPWETHEQIRGRAIWPTAEKFATTLPLGSHIYMLQDILHDELIILPVLLLTGPTPAPATGERERDGGSPRGRGAASRLAGRSQFGFWKAEGTSGPRGLT